MFEIQIERQADKALHSFDGPLRQRIAEDIYALGTRFMEGKRLTGSLKGCRSFRSGEYRIIYDVDLKRARIRVLRIGDRKDVYRRR